MYLLEMDFSLAAWIFSSPLSYCALGRNSWFQQSYSLVQLQTLSWRYLKRYLNLVLLEKLWLESSILPSNQENQWFSHLFHNFWILVRFHARVWNNLVLDILISTVPCHTQWPGRFRRRNSSPNLPNQLSSRVISKFEWKKSSGVDGDQTRTSRV